MSEAKSALEISQWLVDNLGILSGMLILGYILLFVLAFWQWREIRNAKAAWEPIAREQKEREIELDARESQISKKEAELSAREKTLEEKAAELSNREKALKEAENTPPSVMVHGKKNFYNPPTPVL